MLKHALFAGLIVDENDQPVEVKQVGDEMFYVVNDAGFFRHISSEEVDRQILDRMVEQIHGHEDILSDQAAKMLGQDDIFSRALIMNQLKDISKQFDQILTTGIPEDARAYLGMMGFRVVINIHGEIVDFQQPGAAGEDDSGE
ncbi:MAG: hypothetical protein GYA17_11355 [Chloroflexi bacterium]|jgi:hypothetical protein|nr:hypothetical protein [Anaerolineaceae bacterium]NMB88949.1 hypothetical protein [Chloroflexota bacterium]